MIHAYKPTNESLHEQLARVGAGLWRLYQTIELLDVPLVTYGVWRLERVGEDGPSDASFIAPARLGEDYIQVSTVTVTDNEHYKARVE